MKNIRCIMLVMACLSSVPVIATEKQSTVSNLDIIPLHGGVNVVPAFMPDGSATTIIQAWRENGNAHGGREWLVLGPPAEESEHSPGIVTWNDPRRKALETIVGDSPFDGERVLGTIRFARGRVAGKAESLLLDAELDDAPSDILADHATATVRIFRLEATGGDPGDSPFEFKLISTQHSTKRYCNADLALSQMLNLPLPPTMAVQIRKMDASTNDGQRDSVSRRFDVIDHQGPIPIGEPSPR